MKIINLIFIGIFLVVLFIIIYNDDVNINRIVMCIFIILFNYLSFIHQDLNDKLKK